MTRAASILVLGFCAACRSSPIPEPPPAPVPSETRPAVSASAHYLTLPPQTPPATTLVVLLHGVGADADSFHGIAMGLSHALPSAELITVDGFDPFDQAPVGRQWFSLNGITPENRNARVEEGAKRVSAFIDAELDKRKLAHDRLVLIGFSQGAILNTWLATHRSPTPAAVVIFSGRVGVDAPSAGPSVSTPIFWAHGSQDARISVSEVEPGAKVLEAWGAHVTRKVYPGLGHSIDERELADVAEFLAVTVR